MNHQKNNPKVEVENVESTLYYYRDSKGRELYTPNLDFAHGRAKSFKTIQVFRAN